MTTARKLSMMVAMAAFCVQTAHAEDPTELQSEMVEVEEAIADSEAAKAEQVETAKRLDREKKDAASMKEKAGGELKRARRDEDRSRERIAMNEKKSLEAQDEIEKAKKIIEDAKEKMDKNRLEVEKSVAELEKVKKEAQHLADLKKEALAEKEAVEKSMLKAQAKVDDMKRTEKAALKELARSEQELKYVREKAKKSMEKNSSESKEYLRIVQDHRDSLKKIAKKLDEIEVELEVDKAYEEKQERKQANMERSRGVSSMGSGKFAKITSPTCSMRTFPSADSKIVGSYKNGRKVHVKLHDKAWYSSIYNGEKVFLGAGCFE